MKKSIFLFFAAILCAMTANAAKERVYFVNTPGWTKVNVHAWGGTAAGTNWPGTTATKDTWQWNGKDVYYLEAEAGAYGQCIFNNGSGQQSADLTWTANSVYAHEAGKWTPVEIAKATTNGTKVYFVNAEKWTTVKVYAFSYSPKDTKNANWPGANATKESDKIGEYDVYSFTMNKEYDYCIFTNGASSNTKQTADLVVMDGADKYYCKDDWYTKEEAIAKLVAPIEYETVYFVNAADWTGTISAYAYTPVQNAAWPGEPAAKEDYQIGGKNVYSYTAEKGKYKNVIFSGTGGQTADLTWTDGAGKYYVRDNWYTKEEAEAKLAAPVVDVYTVVGSEVLLGTDWDLNNADNEMTKQDDGSYILVKENVDLAKTGTYEYKVVKNHDWSWSVPSGTTNNTLKLGNEDVDGTYNVTFTLNKELNALTASLELVEAKKVIPECYVAGDESLTGQNWNAKSVLMTYDEASEVYTATLTAVPAGTHNMKVVYGGEWLGFDHLATPAPANVKEGDDKKIQFTLAEAGDVTVTYHATNGIGLTGNFAVPETKYYIAGTENLTGFDWKENGLEMTKEGDVYKHTFSEMNAGTYEFKITDGTWEHQWNYYNLGAAYKEVSEGTGEDGKPNGNIKIDTDEAINLTVIFDATAGKITLDGLTPYVAPLTYTVTVPAGTEKCYIAGSMNGWAFQEMEAVTGETNKFTITIIGAKETDEYKYACQADWAYAEVIEGGGNRTKWSALDEVTAWNAPAEPVEMASVVLMGVDGDWATGVEMELNPNDANEYMLLCQSITADEPIKIKAVDTQSTVTWCAKLADTSLGTVEKDADGNENIVLEEGKYDFYYKVAENEVWIGTCTETEPEYNVVEDEITNFVFDTEAWPMVCMGGPSTNYQVEVFLTLTEDADGTLAYEDCSVSIMGTDATFIDGTLSNIDVYAPSADAVLHVLWQEEYYELKLSMSAVSSAAPVDVMAADATVTFSDNEGALKFNGTNVYDDDAVYVELAGFEYNGAGEYTLNGAQISMFENTDAFAFADEVTVAIDEDGYVTVEGVYTSFNGGGIYNVHIWGALPKYTLTLSSDVSDATLTGSDTYYATQEVTVTATQELPGWVFDHWSDGDEKVSTDATYTFRIGKDLELTANYLEIYTRTVTSGSYGTICLPNGSVKVEGAKFYEVTFKKDGYIYADEVTELAAGMPYIFHATSTEVKVYYNETTAAAGSSNGVYGTFSNITDGDAGTTGNVLEGKYLLVAGPQVQKCAGNCSLAANRAYFVVSEISDVEQQSAPGRQRIALGCQDENQATGLDNITENGAVAPALQGTYDILGRQLSEPAVSGFYIINGKKVLVVK